MHLRFCWIGTQVYDAAIVWYGDGLSSISEVNASIFSVL